MEPIRIPLASNLPGPSTTRQVDLQQPVKQLQQEDQVQFSAESEQVAQLTSEMDVTVDRQASRTVSPRGQATDHEVEGPNSATGKDDHQTPGNRLDVEG